MSAQASITFSLDGNVAITHNFTTEAFRYPFDPEKVDTAFESLLKDTGYTFQLGATTAGNDNALATSQKAQILTATRFVRPYGSALSSIRMGDFRTLARELFLMSSESGADAWPEQQFVDFANAKLADVSAYFEKLGDDECRLRILDSVGYPAPESLRVEAARQQKERVEQEYIERGGTLRTTQASDYEEYAATSTRRLAWWGLSAAMAIPVAYSLIGLTSGA